MKQLASEIVRAQKENDGSRAQALLESLVLPNFADWYAQNFGQDAVARVTPSYTPSRIPAQLAATFLGATQEGLKNIEAVRYEDLQHACASPKIFDAMLARRTKLALYELRFAHGDRFRRVFAFAHVDGTFRLVLIPDFAKTENKAAASGEALAPDTSQPADRLRFDGIVQAAKLVCKVAPVYPATARAQGLSGTIRLHAVIGKDGSVKRLELLNGPEILAAAAKKAVEHWRYRPTLLNGDPVEVDTTIDVIFSLGPPY